MTSLSPYPSSMHTPHATCFAACPCAFAPPPAFLLAPAVRFESPAAALPADGEPLTPSSGSSAPAMPTTTLSDDCVSGAGGGNEAATPMSLSWPVPFRGVGIRRPRLALRLGRRHRGGTGGLGGRPKLGHRQPKRRQLGARTPTHSGHNARKQHPHGMSSALLVTAHRIASARTIPA